LQEFDMTQMRRVAFMNRDVRSDSSARVSGHPARRGFTLVEVVVAAAILLIVIVGLAGSFARSVAGFKKAQLLTMAQNLAEFQTEDLKNLAPSVLNELVRGQDADPPEGYQDVNYPYPTRITTAPKYDATARTNDQRLWMYDSGKLATDFMVDGLVSLGGTFIAGGETIPNVPGPSDILLGSNIVAQIYGIDQYPPELRYWKVGTVWGYYNPAWTPLPGLPPAGTTYYYRVILQHQAFPQFSRQIQIAEYDVSLPTGSDPWDPAITSYRDPATDPVREFEYRVTIWYKQNGVDSVLYSAEGTIASPLSMVQQARRAS
jgi:prepilin-type N-terminal cleavage/methylation domain-containing protein